MSALLSGTVFLPLLSLSALQGEADLSLSVNMPLTAHSVVKLGIKAAQDFGGPFTAYLDGFTIPRGFTGPRVRPVAGGLLAAADWLAPVALLDAPLFLGWGLTGAGMGLHVEGLVDFDGARGVLQPVPLVFAGVDVTLRFTYANASIPVGVGVGAALDTRDPASFDPSRDLGIYLFTGFDSFSDSARRASGMTPVQGRQER